MSTPLNRAAAVLHITTALNTYEHPGVVIGTERSENGLVVTIHSDDDRSQEYAIEVHRVNRRKFTRAELAELGLPHDGGDIVVADLGVDSGRWTERRALILRLDGRLWRLLYEVGLTENQVDTDPWRWADIVDAIEVRPVVEETVSYRIGGC